MPRHDFDPLASIPQPQVVREKLQDVERIAQRLRTLLRFAEEIHEHKTDVQGKEVAIEP